MTHDHSDEIIHRELDEGVENPGVEVARIIAELEGVDVTELATVWDCIDDAVREIFTNPPAPEAQVEVSYSYEGYRVTVEQNGRVKLIEAR